MAHDVFISHSSKDKLYADAVCAKLESEGVRCWIAPRDILPGMAWGTSIIEAIESAKLMVLVFSSNANSSPQIEREVERALNHELTIVPLRIEQVVPGKNLEYFLGTPHWLDAVSPPFDQHLDYIAQTIKILLEHRDSGQTVEIPRPPEPRPPRPAELVKNAARRIPIGMLAAAGVAILVVLGWWLLHGGPVPAKLVGTWTMTNFLGPDRIQFTLRVRKPGGYRYEAIYTEAGRVDVHQGKVFFETADGLERSVGSVLPGSVPPMPSDLLDAVPEAVWNFIGKFSRISSPQLPTVNPFTQVRAGRPGAMGAKAQPAVWEWDAAFGKIAWLLRFEFDYNGGYIFTARAVDVGHLVASDGRWKATSDVLDVQSQGRYSFVGDNTLVQTGTVRDSAPMSNAGNTLWERLEHGVRPRSPHASMVAAATATAVAHGSATIAATPAASPAATATPVGPPIMTIDRKFLLSRNTRVYAQPYASSKVVGHLRRGRWVHITGLTGNWLRVDLGGGAVGFVPDKAVE